MTGLLMDWWGRLRGGLESHLTPVLPQRAGLEVFRRLGIAGVRMRAVSGEMPVAATIKTLVLSPCSWRTPKRSKRLGGQLGPAHLYGRGGQATGSRSWLGGHLMSQSFQCLQN